MTREVEVTEAMHLAEFCWNCEAKPGEPCCDVFERSSLREPVKHFHLMRGVTARVREEGRREGARWIPVGESLPEHGVEVLAVEAWGLPFLALHYAKVGWRSRDGWAPAVKHWMPKPPRPSPEEPRT